MYWKQIIYGYITAIGTGKGNEKITETQYNEILAMLRNIPTAPDGFAYRLTAELEWELYELPTVEEAEEATADDYEAALAEMGVEV